MEPLQPSDPETIGKYRISGRLGAGGMGSVYLGLSPGGRPAAVKVINAQLQYNPESLARFRREVETLRTVRNAYTAALIDSELTIPPFWLATEYIPGLTLAETIARNGPAPADTCFGLLAALAEGLADIHEHGICHRDLKPQNIILSTTGPRLIDFGIARSPEQVGMTQVGMTVGTPGYTAPEVLTVNDVGPPADVFALGATIAYTATGRPPFGDGTPTVIAMRGLNSEIDLAGVGPDLAAAIRACVATDLARRPTPMMIVAQCQQWAAAAGRELNTGAALFPAAAPRGTRTAVLPSSPAGPPAQGTRRYTASASVPVAGAYPPAPPSRPDSRRMPGLMPPSPTMVGQHPAVPGSAPPQPGSAPPQPGASSSGRPSGPILALLGVGVAVVLLLAVLLAVQLTGGGDKSDQNSAAGSSGTPTNAASPSAASPSASQSPTATETTAAPGSTVRAEGAMVSSGGLCVEIPDTDSNGDLVVLDHCDGSDRQHWVFGADGSLKADGKCLDLANDASDLDNMVQIWDCNGSGAQMFEQLADRSIRNPASGLCLGAGTTSHSEDPPDLLQGDCTGDPFLAWKFS